MPVETHVGARLEAVAPRKVTDTGDRVRLVALLAVAVAVHAWLVAHTFVTARDSIGFARAALQLQDPNVARLPGDPPQPLSLSTVLRRMQHPPGYPLAVLAASGVVRSAYDAPLPDQMLLSTQVASSVAAVLLVFPTYWLGRMLFGKFAGFAAALLVQVLPVAAHVTADGLTEGLYLLTLATAMLLGVRAVRKPGVGGFLTTGLATGLSYLVRPEGLAVAVAVGAVAVGLAATRRWPRALAAGRVTALGVGVILPAVPYMVMIGGVSNKPSVDGAIQNIRTLITQGDAPNPEGMALFAAWYVPDEDGPKAVWVAKALVKETTKSFHYAPAVLAVVGLAAAARRVRAEPWVWVPVLFGAVNVGLLVALGWKSGYLSERHTLPVVFVGCFFAAAGLLELPALLGRLPAVGTWLRHPAVPGVALAAVVASCLPATAKPLHENRAGHVAAGRYLAEHLDRDDAGNPLPFGTDALVDPFEWAKYYAGRTVRTIPPDDPNARVVYAVLEGSKDENPHSRLPQLQDALNVANDGNSKVVFRFPEGVPDDQVRVKVYKLVRDPKRGPPAK